MRWVIGPDELLKYLWMALPEQLDHFEHFGVLFESVRLKYVGGTQWQQSHHGTDFQAHGIAVGEMQQIVEEPIRRVPHLVVASADMVHCVSNPRELLKEAAGNFLIDRVVLGQDECDLQHA